MGVAKKLKQRPSSQPNLAKPKKEAVAKISKKPSKETKSKPVVGKKSSRIQNRSLKTKIEPKPDVKNKKPTPAGSSPPQGKTQKTRSPPQNKASAPQTSLPAGNKRSARNAATSGQLSPQIKKSARTPALSSKADNGQIAAVGKPLRNAKNKKAPKPVSKNDQVVAKPVNTNTSAKPTKKVTKQAKAETPSIASKLQKKKRKSVKSPLKKKLGGRIVKSKKRSFSQKGSSPVVKKAKKKPSSSQLKLAVEQNRGVVYFSHLPHGFYEKELKEYCTQFGAVTGVHLPRSVNGKAKGFAFVEFKHPEVAEVVAETMNNYLMHTRLVKAELVPLERQKPWIFRNGVDAVKLAKKKKADALAARTRKLTPEEEKAQQKKALARVNRLKKKLATKGIDLDFTVVS